MKYVVSLLFVIALIISIESCNTQPEEMEISTIEEDDGDVLRGGEDTSSLQNESIASTTLPMPNDPEAYQIINWSAEDYLDALNLLETKALEAISPRLDSCTPLVYCRDLLSVFLRYQDSIRIVLYESFSRFPDLANEENLQWKLTLAEAVTGGTSDLDDRILELLEDRIRAGYYDPNNIDRFLEGTGFRINTSVTQSGPILVDNLFGDGHASPILVVSTSDAILGEGDDGIVIAMRRDEEGSYRPVKLLSRWNLSGHFNEIYLEDLTGDEKPEVVVDYIAVSGSLSDRMIDIFHWQDSEFVRVTPSRSSLYSPNFLEWDIGPPDNQGLPSFNTYERTVAPSYLITRVYSWNGAVYELRDVQAQVQGNISGLEIELSGYYFDVETQIELIETYLSNWPNDEVDSVGSSYPDYLRFKLAMLNILQNRTTEAVAILQGLIDEPINQEIKVVSAAAQAYLDAYVKEEDTYQGCKDAFSVLDEALGDTRTVWTLDQWGFARYMPGSICSDREAIVPIIRRCGNKGFDQSSQIADCLQKVELSAQDYRVVDLDGDGDQDLVALIPWDTTFWGNKGIGFWVFTDTGEGVADFKMYSGAIKQDAEMPEFTFESFDPGSKGQIVHIFHMDHDLTVFDTQHTEREDSPRLLLESDNVVSYKIMDDPGSPDLLITELDPEDTTLRVKMSDDQFIYINPGTVEITYQWDSETESFMIFDTQIDDYTLPLSYWSVSRAESLLFNQNDNEVVIPLLLRIIDDAETEYFHPRALYLLGLAYERIGYQSDAVEAYWRLWRDYPDDPYGLLAQSKLTLRE